MGIAADGANILLGKGMLYFDRFTTAGVATGERFLGNCTKIEAKPSTEVKEKYDSTTSGAPLLKQAVIRENLEITVTMDEFIKENLALVLMGTDTTDYTQSATTVTDEAIKSCEGGRYINLANRALTSVTNVKKGATVYTVTDDYTVDLVNGRIYVVPGGAIDLLTHPDNLTSTYVPTAIAAADMVYPALVGAIEGFLRFKADPSAGPIWDAEFWKVSFTPSGVLALIGEDFGAMDLSGKLLSDATNHPTCPYGRLIKR